MCSGNAEMKEEIIIEALQHTYCVVVPAGTCTPPVTPSPPTPTLAPAPASPCVVKRRVMQISVHDCTFCIGAKIIISQSQG